MTRELEPSPDWSRGEVVVIRRSIDKWRGGVALLAAGTPWDGTYWDDCALCKMFFHARGGGVCGACPISRVTGLPVCKGTPFTQYATEVRRGQQRLDIQLALARKMLKFLEDLLVGRYHATLINRESRRHVRAADEAARAAALRHYRIASRRLAFARRCGYHVRALREQEAAVLEALTDLGRAQDVVDRLPRVPR